MRTLLCFCISGLISVLLVSPGRSAEPAKTSTVTLTDEVVVKPKDIFIRKMVISPDGGTAYVVGEEYHEPLEEPDRNVIPPEVVTPKGYVIDFAKKSSKEFLNDHRRPIVDMVRTKGGKQIYTVSNHSEGQVRVWDVVKKESSLHIHFKSKELFKSDEGSSYDGPVGGIDIALLPSRGGVAALLDDKIALTAKNPKDRVDLDGEPFKDTIVSNPSVDHQDLYLACHTRETVLVWNLKTKEVYSTIPAVPKHAPDSPDNISIRDMRFANTSSLIYIVRNGNDDEILEDERAKEDKVPSDKRGIWVVDIKAGTTEPLGFGTSRRTERFALDPTDRWMAIAGTAFDDNGEEFDNKVITVFELRIYDMKTKALVLRKQFKNFDPYHLHFSDDGKKLICAGSFGEVRSWSINVTDK